MKKYISFALLIVLAISLLAGCRKNVGEETFPGDTTSTTAPTTTAPTTKPTTTQPSSTDTTNNSTNGTDNGRSRYPSAIMG